MKLNSKERFLFQIFYMKNLVFIYKYSKAIQNKVFKMNIIYFTNNKMIILFIIQIQYTFNGFNRFFLSK